MLQPIVDNTPIDVEAEGLLEIPSTPLGVPNTVPLSPSELLERLKGADPSCLATTGLYCDTEPDVEPLGTSTGDSTEVQQAAFRTGNVVPTAYSPWMSYTKAANYALLWTDSSHANRINTAGDYSDHGNNFTNFVSQAFRAGGRSYDGGVNPKDTGNWSPNLTGPAGASYTWAGAPYLPEYLKKKGLSPNHSVYQSTLGDPIFINWPGRSSVFDHAVIVTTYTSSGNFRISAKTSNRHNIAFSAFQKLVYQAHGTSGIRWYSVRT